MANLETQLVDLFRKLPAAEQASLVAFAEFLLGRSGAVPVREPTPPEPVVIPDPVPVPRPAQESVVKAVKRLAQTYPMLDKSKMLNDTSTLVMQHVIQGRDAVEVIDELEIVFERYYAQLKEKE
ncbi:MAG: Crp/Fnr family transcriptional regulator [Gammaproteobacteria bacterium]|nr:Crp/Fnr family transcriptional regulator [Gammaproteobacteria bacterium]